MACHPVTLNDRLWDADGWRQLRALKARQFDLVINLFDEPDELAMAKKEFFENAIIQKAYQTDPLGGYNGF